MKLSVIIPIYNEEKSLPMLLESLQDIRQQAEIIFVDGGSTDGTIHKIPRDCMLIRSEKGRAVQMNTGARASTGDVLFFLHCDSRLPPQAIAQMTAVLEKYSVGCFGIVFPSKNVWMKICQMMSNLRVRFGKIMFGDQGIFIRREIFFVCGGFPNLPIMEDYQFSLTLKEKKVPIGMTKNRICTSVRRFQSEAHPLKVMWQMQRLRAKYRKGIPIEQIATMYRDIR